MTDQDANDILEYLITQMEYYGYGEIIRQVRVRLEEDARVQQTETYNLTPRSQLRFYLDNSSEILESISSETLKSSIDRLNTALSNEEKISEINVELITGQLFNLNDLPSYNPVVVMLKEIKSELSNE